MILSRLDNVMLYQPIVLENNSSCGHNFPSQNKGNWHKILQTAMQKLNVVLFEEITCGMDHADRR